MLANALNKNEINNIKAENLRLKNNSQSTPSNKSDLTLTESEIKEKIAEAEKSPENFSFQKGLGLALYRYSMMKQDGKLLEEVLKLLERANKINPDDYEVIVSLGNLYFDFGQLNKDPESNKKARNFYLRALEKNPRDINVRTDLGLTYLLNDSPQFDLALKELNKSLQLNPKHEKTLQFIAQLHIDQGNKLKAAEFVNKLKEINPENKGLPDLQKALEKEIK
jgi:tetratricopeptide (TPR) repeat protein